MDKQRIFLSPFFLIGLLLLLLNDFYLKAQLHNAFTGKLSDFAGLFIFPLFFAALLPHRRILIYILTGFAFIFWKSPYSTALIELWNWIEIFRIGRAIDYTDLYALFILPVSYFYFVLQDQQPEPYLLNSAKQITTLFVALVSVFAFTATSFEDERTVSIDRKYELKMTKNEFEAKLKNIRSVSNSKIDRDIDKYPADKYPQRNTKPNSYSGFFILTKNYCDSNNLYTYIYFEEEKDQVFLNGIVLGYWCKRAPSEADKNQITLIFEREVVEKLRQNSSQ